MSWPCTGRPRSPRPWADGGRCSRLGEKRDASGVQVVIRGLDQQVARADALLQHLAFFREPFRDQSRIGARHLLDIVMVVLSGGLDGGCDGFHHVGNVIVVMPAFHRGRHGTAAFVSQNEDQRHMNVFGGVLEGAENQVVLDVAGVTDHEQVADALVKDDFRGDAGIGAAEDRGERFLARAHFLEAGHAPMGSVRCGGGEAAVALHQLLQRGLRTELGWGSGWEGAGSPNQEYEADGENGFHGVVIMSVRSEERRGGKVAWRFRLPAASDLWQWLSGVTLSGRMSLNWRYDDEGGAWRPRASPMLWALLVLNVAAFAVQQLLSWRDPILYTRFMSWFGLTAGNGVGEGLAWQMLTSLFLHEDVISLFWGAALLCFSGFALERLIGRWRLLWTYLSGGLGGGALWFLFNWGGPAAVLVGASGAVCAILIAFAMLEPAEIVCFRLFSRVAVRARSIAFGIVAGSIIAPLLLSPGGGDALVCLGGALVGFACARFYTAQWRWLWLPTRGMPHLPTVSRKDFTEIPQGGDFMRRRIDPILDKIGEHGIQSLTPEERRLLDVMKDRRG